MKIPPDAQLVIRAFAHKFWVPRTNEEDARAWTAKLVGQLAFSCGPTWVHKSQSPSHPPSADTIAQILSDGTFLGWDVVANSGSADAALNLGAESQDLAGQYAIVVPPKNWLAEEPQKPPEQTGCPCEAKLDEILAELRAQRDAVERTSAELVAAVKGGIKIRF